MPKFTPKDWDDVRRRFRSSIMADTSLNSLAQSLDTSDWPVKGEEEKPAKYIDFDYTELLLQPEIGGSEKRADHLIGILKETLAFDDPFGDMVAQVEESTSRENPVLKTLERLGIPAAYPLNLVSLSEGTRTICQSEGVLTLGEFANLAQQMSTRVVIGGDFRMLLNALSHGNEDGIGQFMPFRRGAKGLHLPEALGLAAGRLSRTEQLGLAKAYGLRLIGVDDQTPALSGAAMAKAEQVVNAATEAALSWFATESALLADRVKAGAPLERELVVLADPAREIIAARAYRQAVGGTLAEQPAATPRKSGFFARLFGRQ